MKLLVVPLATFCMWWLVSGGEESMNTPMPLTFNEEELLNSHLWKQPEIKLLIVKRGVNGFPSEDLEVVLKELEGTSLTVVEVLCPEEPTGRVCSLLSRHEAILKRRGVEGGVVPIQPLFTDSVGYSISIIELLIGEAITHIDSHSSLASFIDQNRECFVILVLKFNSPEYFYFLKSYFVEKSPLALGVTAAKESLPLSRRPTYSAKEPPLHIYNVRGSGQHWYKLHQPHLMKEFILRTEHPVILPISEIKDFLNQGTHLAIFFPALSKVNEFDLQRFVEALAERIYLSFIFFVGDREGDSEMARRFSIKDDLVRPQVRVLPQGSEKRPVVIEVDSNMFDREVFGVSDFLLSIASESNLKGSGDVEEEEEEEEDVRISITYLQDVDILIERTNYNLVVAFCKKGSEKCPDEVYFSLEDAQKAFIRIKLNITYHFFIVECDSVTDVLKYKLNSLPSFFLYDRNLAALKRGTGDIYYYRDVLVNLAEATGHMELLDLSPEDTYSPGALPNFPSKTEDDIYGILGNTLPRPSPPDELMLTDENFNERIKKFDKTAVLFYIHWSVENVLVLHHVMAAWERLDKSENVTLGCVDCHSYTSTCSRFHLSSLPSLLLFTPSTLDAPTLPPAAISVLDSTHFLRALGQQPQDATPLMELTPASLPLVLRKSLTTPLILWCAVTPSSELGVVFTETSLAKDYSHFGFAWMNSSEHSRLLASAFAVEGDNLPMVLAVQFDKFTVYQMESSGHTTFREQLTTFLDQLKQGALKPTRSLSRKNWLPVQRPIPFPSSPNLDKQGSFDDKKQNTGPGEGVYGKDGFEVIGEFDMQDIPFSQPPQVKEYPIVEDQGHEEAIPFTQPPQVKEYEDQGHELDEQQKDEL